MCTDLIDGFNKPELSLCRCSNRLVVIIPTLYVVEIWLSCVIPGFRREVDENYAVMGSHAASSDFSSTFRDNLSVPYSGVDGCSETSVRNYHCLLRNNPEERSARLAVLSEVYSSLYPSRRCCSIVNWVTNRCLPNYYQLMWSLVTWVHYKLRSVRMLLQISETNISKIRLSAFSSKIKALKTIKTNSLANPILEGSWTVHRSKGRLCQVRSTERWFSFHPRDKNREKNQWCCVQTGCVVYQVSCSGGAGRSIPVHKP
jgi:hypothetical protein